MERLRQLRQFLVEVWAELHKTTWPPRREVGGTTLVVITTVFICAFFLWIVDILLTRVMEAIFKVFGS
jgi:preprotein translocase subunit SecE